MSVAVWDDVGVILHVQCRSCKTGARVSLCAVGVIVFAVVVVVEAVVVVVVVVVIVLLGSGSKLLQLISSNWQMQ